MIKDYYKKYRFIFILFISSALVLAIIPATVISLLMPDMVSKYKLELKQSYDRADTKLLTFYEDLNSDGKKEKIDILNYRGRFASCLYNENDGSLLGQFNFYGSIPGQENLSIPIFNDINKDGYKEMFLFTQKADSLFINAVDFSTLEVILYGRFVSTIGNGNGITDFVLRHIINHDYNGDSIPEIYFLLNGGYALYPRKIMAYDYINDTLISSINTGSQHYVTSVTLPNNELVLISTTPGSDNCPADFPYPYRDSCSWLFGFNDRLEFIFDPIPFPGKTCSVNGPILINDEFHYYILNEGGVEQKNYFLSVNLQGDIYKKQEILNLDQIEKLMPITVNNKKHYILHCIQNNLFKVYEYNPNELKLEQTNFTRNIPDVSLVPFEMDKNETAFLAYNFRTNISSLLLDDLKREVSFNSRLYIKPYNLYVQTQKIDEGKIIIVTDRKYLYTFLLTKNIYFPFRLLIFLVIYALCTGFIFLVQYLHQRRVRNREKLQKEIASLQLQLINSQLDPHFTFNALNTVSAKILKGERYEAYDLMNSFSNIMRSAMLFSEKESWSLEEELKFTNDYLSLMKVRFAPRFNFSIESGENIKLNKMFIPRLLVQNFAENAVKHAFTNINYPGFLTISIYQIDHSIEIQLTDNGIGREKAKINADASSNKSGKGITLNRKQLEIFNKLHLTSIHFVIEDIYTKDVASGTRIKITIPFTK